jgi:protein-disulfide isomerase
MEINRMDDNRWVNARMKSLEPEANLRPDVARALGRFRRRRHASARKRNWIFVGAAATLSLIVLGDMAPSACANPRGCVEPQAAPAAAVPAKTGFKMSGNPRAPITIEVYSDYECPSCAQLFKETMPLLDAQYVKTGKIKILHRDFPLAQHPYARLAARYANAAGEIGRYDVVVDRLFRTQEEWSKGGDIASALRQTLTPDEMKTVQRAVAIDSHLDDTVTADMAMAQKDQIGHTPTLVVVSKGKRQVIQEYPVFSILKGYLDSLLSQ